MPDGKPDLSGFYDSVHRGANYGLEEHPAQTLTPPGQGIVVDPPDGKLPMQEWAKAEVKSRQTPARGYDDPTAHCIMAAGVPRGFYVPSPFFIMQTPTHVVVLFERMAWRQIPLEPTRKHLPDTIRLCELLQMSDYVSAKDIDYAREILTLFPSLLGKLLVVFGVQTILFTEQHQAPPAPLQEGKERARK